MPDRLQQIGELLRQELAERNNLDPGDVCTDWVALVARTELANDGRMYSAVSSVGSTVDQPRHIELGLIEAYRLTLHGVYAAVGARPDEEDDP